MESDEDGEPRILLYGRGPYNFVQSYLLQVDCISVRGISSLELFVKEVGEIFVSAPEFLLSRFFNTEVVYKIDDRRPVSSTWRSFDWEDEEINLLFEETYAPAMDKSKIVAALLDGAQNLEVTVDADKDYAATYTFQTHGFAEAVKPVLEYCGE